MDFFVKLLTTTVDKVMLTVLHNWPLLMVGILIAAGTRTFLDQNRVAGFLNRHKGKGVLAATAAGVTTPLCSCGTTAVILGMMAGEMPWAPIIAFMVASPLTSPGELFYSASLFGWPFALIFFAAAIVLGLAGGAAGSILERRGWLSGQARMARTAEVEEAASSEPDTGGGQVELFPVVCCESAGRSRKPDWRRFVNEAWLGAKSLLPRFLGFAFIGYLLNGLIPQEWVNGLFGSGHVYSVPLAATIGLPLYFNTETSLPLLRALMDGGMSHGAGLAFLITGAGTSMGAVAGALTIARWRVIALVVAVLWVGAVIFGFGLDAAMAAGLLR